MRNENIIIVNEHDLIKLFEALSQNLTEAIISNHNKYFMQVMNTALSYEIFVASLKCIATTFNDYRYEYEWGTRRGLMINGAFFECFASAVFDYAQETIKDNNTV